MKMLSSLLVIALMALSVSLHEYAPNGSLRDILHGQKGVKGALPGLVLSWAQRVKIAVGQQEDLNIYTRRHNLISSIVISSPAIYCFLMMISQRLLILICQMKPDNAPSFHSCTWHLWLSCSRLRFSRVFQIGASHLFVFDYNGKHIKSQSSSY